MMLSTTTKLCYLATQANSKQLTNTSDWNCLTQLDLSDAQVGSDFLDRCALVLSVTNNVLEFTKAGLNLL